MAAAAVVRGLCWGVDTARACAAVAAAEHAGLRAAPPRSTHPDKRSDKTPHHRCAPNARPAPAAIEAPTPSVAARKRQSGRRRSTQTTDQPSRHRPPNELAAAGPDKQGPPRSQTPHPHPANPRPAIHDRPATPSHKHPTTTSTHITALTPTSQLRQAIAGDSIGFGVEQAGEAGKRGQGASPWSFTDPRQAAPPAVDRRASGESQRGWRGDSADPLLPARAGSFAAIATTRVAPCYREGSRAERPGHAREPFLRDAR
jgi:hypothetical protein